MWGMVTRLNREESAYLLDLVDCDPLHYMMPNLRDKLRNVVRTTPPRKSRQPRQKPINQKHNIELLEPRR